ncbi:MAG: MFS transporter [Rubrivivax sp.]|nr:MFS transporter [Rubrivivax sp.]
MPKLLWLFSLVNLIVGTAAFSVTGILPELAAGLGVGVPAAGQAMTAFALSTAVLAPSLLVLTGSWPRRSVLLLGMGLFTAGCAACAAAPNLAALLAGRVLMGVGAVYIPVAAGIAITLVPPHRRGQALALVFLGMSLSYVVGLPVAAWATAGWGFRVALWGAVALALVAFALLAWRVPRGIQAPGASFAGLWRVLRRADIRSVLALTLVYFIAIFIVFSYIAPVLRALVPMDATQLSLTLSLFGIAGMLGTLSGGAANDRFGARRTLVVQLLVLGTTMVLLPLTAGRWGWMMAVMFAWGVAGFGMMAPQQSRLAALAPREAPLLLSLNSSMLYTGTALGAALGGALAPVVGFAHLSWPGVAAVLAGLALLIASRRFDPPPAVGLNHAGAAPASGSSGQAPAPAPQAAPACD